MALEVFWASGSTPAWRVLLALAIKGVTYESRQIHFLRRDNRRPEFLAVSPRGKVPAIRDGDFTLHESLAILIYLERRFPTPPLFGETPEEAGLIHRFVSEHDAYYGPAVLRLSRPILYGGPGALVAKDEEIRAAAATLGDELARIEAALDGRAHLTGARLTAADVVFYPSIQLTQRVAAHRSAARFDMQLGPLAARFPRIAAWSARIEALPGYDATYPPHWR